MRTTTLRASAVSVLFTFATLAGLPLLSSGAAPQALVYHRTAPISYLPIRGAVVPGNTPTAWATGTGAGSPSSQAGAATTVPGTPRISSVTPGVASVTVKWSLYGAGYQGVTNYLVRYSSNAGSTWTVVSTGSTKTTFVVTGLSVVPYTFEVAAVNSVGAGAYSLPSPSVTPTAPATVPSAPTITGVTALTGAVGVSWSVPTSNGGATITSYTVRDSVDGGATWSVLSTSVTTTSYTASGLTAGTSYVFDVAARNSAGLGAWSAPSASVTPLAGATVPGAPTITGVQAGVGSVQVSWNPPASNGGSSITAYAVRDSSNGGSTWSVATTSAGASPYTVSGLTAGTSYVFEVAATNSVGTGAWSAPSASATPTAATDNGIQYHGGPVMVNNVHVYEIWYGNWTTVSTPKRQTLIDTFLHGIGGTPYFNINSSYYNGSGTFVKNVVTVSGSATVTSGSTSLTSNSFGSIVANTITSGALPADANGVYFVFTSSNVSVNGFLTQYCGFHTAETVNGTNLQYSFVGDPSGSSIGNCSAQTGSSPNGDVAGDAMVSVVAHELSESTTDPQLNAWYNTTSGEENGDLCAWTFGSTFAAPNGSAANVTWTINGVTYNYLIQRNWVNAAGGYCALSY